CRSAGRYRQCGGAVPRHHVLRDRLDRTRRRRRCLKDEAQCLLVIIGATPEGKKELVGLIDGMRESAQSWKELLLDLKRRGLTIGPELAVADGALGFWQAVEE